MASTSRKKCEFLVDEEISEELLAGDSEVSDLSSESDSDNEVHDCSELDVIAYPVSDDEVDREDDWLENEDFVWEDMKDFQEKREVFVGSSGPQNEAKCVKSIVESFQLFFNVEFVQSIASSTNTYAEQFYSSVSILHPQKSRVMTWEPVTVDEVYITLGLFMLMGIVQKPTLRSYFTKRRVISTPGFSDVMTRDRFERICKFLHITDNQTLHNYIGPPKLHKIFPVISHLNSRFQEFYSPKRDISIDESLTLWKGRLYFKQFLPLKSSRFGIKTYELYDSKTGYLWSFIVYTGKDTVFESPLAKSNTNKTSAIVLKLIEPLINQGRTVWMDNFYNSPFLARVLKVKYHTDCAGTVKLNRRNIPKLVKDKQLKRGEVIAQHASPVTVLKWKDKKTVTMISTFHNDETTTVTKKNKETVKPVCVVDYNRNMGGVDLKD